MLLRATHTYTHQSMDMEKTNVSGYEYMDKAVQLPFSLPLPAEDKVIFQTFK